MLGNRNAETLKRKRRVRRRLLAIRRCDGVAGINGRDEEVEKLGREERNECLRSVRRGGGDGTKSRFGAWNHSWARDLAISSNGSDSQYPWCLACTRSGITALMHLRCFATSKSPTNLRQSNHRPGVANKSHVAENWENVSRSRSISASASSGG